MWILGLKGLTQVMGQQESCVNLLQYMLTDTHMLKVYHTARGYVSKSLGTEVRVLSHSARLISILLLREVAGAFSSLPEKTRMSNHVCMSEQSQHISVSEF